MGHTVRCRGTLPCWLYRRRGDGSRGLRQRALGVRHLQAYQRTCLNVLPEPPGKKKKNTHTHTHTKKKRHPAGDTEMDMCPLVVPQISCTADTFCIAAAMCTANFIRTAILKCTPMPVCTVKTWVTSETLWGLREPRVPPRELQGIV